YQTDALTTNFPLLINHRSLFNGGGIATVIRNRRESGTRPLLQFEQKGEVRDVAWSVTSPEWKGGKVVYLRGTNSSNFTGSRLLTPDNPEQYFPGPAYLRYALQKFGISIGIDRLNPSIKSPVLTVARSDNAFIFSGYHPNSTVRDRFRFPQGAPLLLGLETILENGHSTYQLPTSWNRECRVVVEQKDGMVDR